MNSASASAGRSAATAPAVLVCPLDAPVRTERYRDLLTASERARIERLGDRGERDRALLGRALLRLELAERLGCRPEAVAFSYGPEGKPTLAGGDAWHFNLSHSARCVVLALAPWTPVGIDVEWRARGSRIDALARHYFGADEHAELEALAPAQRRRRFFRQWTVKEAVTKALGGSLWRMLPGIRLTGDVDVRLELSGAAACSAPLAWWHFDLGDDYSLGLAQLASAGDAPLVCRAIPGEMREPWSLQPESRGHHR